jgi:hypothetical protein
MPKHNPVIGVFVKPQYKDTNPMAAKNAWGNWIHSERDELACDPIKNNGVASPPLKPNARLKVVANNFDPANSILEYASWNGCNKNSDPKPILILKVGI